MKLSDYPANLQRGSFSPRRGCVLIGDFLRCFAIGRCRGAF